MKVKAETADGMTLQRVKIDGAALVWFVGITGGENAALFDAVRIKATPEASAKVPLFRARIDLASPYEFVLKTVVAKDHSEDPTYYFKSIRGSKEEVPLV